MSAILNDATIGDHLKGPVCHWPEASWC